MNNFLKVIIFLMFTPVVFAGFAFSNKSSQIKVSANSTFQIDSAINGWNGTLAIDNGGTVTGNSIQFQDGLLADSASESGAVEGSFERNFTGVVVDNISMTGNQGTHINGDVRGTVFVAGLNNKITGNPRFLNPINLSNSIATSLAMGITKDCDVDINLNGGTLTLDNKLILASGKKITSSGAVGTLNLNNETLVLGSVAAGWTDEFNIQNNGTIELVGSTTLKNVWTIGGEVSLSGNGNIFDITHAAAKIVIDSGATLILNDVLLKGVQNLKLVFQDATSKLKLVNAKLAMTGNFNQTTGELISVSESKIFMTTSMHAWIFSADGLFLNQGATLWLDTGASDTPPTFGFDSGAVAILTYVNGDTVKQVVDFELVRESVVRYLVSGSVDQNVEIEASFFVQPTESLVFTGNSDVTSNGVNINFSNTPEPQFVITENNQVTFTGNQTLSVYSNTMDIQEGAILGISGETQITLNGDLSFPTGTIKITNPGGTLTLAGIGGTKRVGLSSAPGIVPAVFDIGYGDLVISNADFFGLQQVKKSRSFVNNVLREGRIVLDGACRVHVQENTDMNFHVRGAGNVLVIEKNNVKFTGKITFDEFSDNTLEVRFELDAENDQLGIMFGKDSMNLFSTGGIARLHFNDYDVLIDNLDPDSFLVGGHAFLTGQFLRVKTNPIKQGSSDLSLGRDLVFLVSGDLRIPVEVVSSVATLGLRRGANFLKSFSFNLPEYEHYFANRSLTRAPRRPQLRIPGIIDSRNSKDVIRIQKNGQITNFGVDPFASLELQFSGGARVKPPVRRLKRNVKPVRAVVTPNFNDPEYTDQIKDNDKIYVSGQDNKIIVTGNFEVRGQIIMDEGAELIFEFDDSIDTSKAVRIATTTEAGESGLLLPKSASIIFQGAGQVLFQDESRLTFAGEEPTLISATAGLQAFNDNRPSLIFKNYAELAVDLNETIEMEGRGQVLFQNNASARISRGQVLLGLASDDIFNLTVDRKSSIRLGSIFDEASNADFNGDAYFSLGAGNFSVKFDRDSLLQIRNGGAFEVALDKGVYHDGHAEEFDFVEKSTLDVGPGGRLALGQLSLSEGGVLNSKFSWNNLDATIIGGGVVALFTADDYNAPLLTGILQNRKFSVLSGALNVPASLASALGVTKKLIQITENGVFPTKAPFLITDKGLWKAVDFIDADDNYKIITPTDNVVQLELDDRLRREHVIEGTVYGTHATGIDFAVFSNGQIQDQGQQL